MHVHKLRNLSVWVRHQRLVCPALQDDTTANICKRVELLDKRDAVGDQNAGFGSKQTVGSNDVVENVSCNVTVDSRKTIV